MKHKITPLLIAGLGFLVYGIYLFIFSERSTQGYETLFAFGTMAVGFVGLLVYIVLRVIFPKKLIVRLIIECLIIFAFTLICYLN